MAYFRCQQGNSSGSAGATITVTYDSSFYNKTMTCTNGTKTYTKTTTSSGSTTFNVSEEGTWTITCNGVSRTVNVVLSYTTQMAITKTVTVHGAVGATISFTDTTGSKTVTLNSSGQGSVDITFIPPSATITFTDTNKAKNPYNLSQNYSKTITLTDSTTAIYVMLDNALYWFGYKNVNAGDAKTLGYTTPSNTYANITENTSSALLSVTSGVTKGYGVDNAIDITNVNKVKVLASYSQTGSSPQYFGGLIGVQTTKDGATTVGYSPANEYYVTSVRECDVSELSGNHYIQYWAYNTGDAILYAMWYE